MGCLRRAHCGSATIAASVHRSSYLDRHSPRLPRFGEPLLRNIAVAASRLLAARPGDHAMPRATSVVQMSSLKVAVPGTVDVNELEHEIVTALADRLRDDHGYELVAAVSANASGTGNEYPMRPAGSIAVEQEPGVLRVKLQGVQV